MSSEMNLKLAGDSSICTRCGTRYDQRGGYFYQSLANTHKGIGWIPICRDCINTLYNTYLAQCGDKKWVVRQLCRKLDIYWSEKIYEAVEKRNTPRTMLSAYFQRVRQGSFAGKSYDDTLSEEGTLWSFIPNIIKPAQTDGEEAAPVVSEETKKFWGPGYSDDDYSALADIYTEFVSKLPEGVDMNDMGTVTLVKQICGLEFDIARDRASGKSVDRAVSTLNSLLGSANLKPAQKKQEDDDSNYVNTPLGVWLYRYENKRPLPEVEEDAKSRDKILKYVFTWLGHVCKMLGKKNGFTKLYEDEVERLRIERPDIDEDDDEDFLMDIFEETDVEDMPEDIDDDESAEDS